MLFIVRFGSVAASQQFITWAAGFGQELTFAGLSTETYVVTAPKFTELLAQFMHKLSSNDSFKSE